MIAMTPPKPSSKPSPGLNDADIARSNRVAAGCSKFPTFEPRNNASTRFDVRKRADSSTST